MQTAGPRTATEGAGRERMRVLVPGAAKPLAVPPVTVGTGGRMAEPAPHGGLTGTAGEHVSFIGRGSRGSSPWADRETEVPPPPRGRTRRGGPDPDGRVRSELNGAGAVGPAGSGFGMDGTGGDQRGGRSVGAQSQQARPAPSGDADWFRPDLKQVARIAPTRDGNQVDGLAMIGVGIAPRPHLGEGGG